MIQVLIIIIILSCLVWRLLTITVCFLCLSGRPIPCFVFVCFRCLTPFTCWSHLNHLSTLTSLKHSPYIPLPDLHTHLWRQQFHWRFMRRSLLRTLLQPGANILYPCFLIGHSGNSSFGFCNIFLFLGAGYQPAAQSPSWRTRGCSLSGLYPLTNLAWLDLQGTKVPGSPALWVIETYKLHHHNKVSA